MIAPKALIPQAGAPAKKAEWDRAEKQRRLDRLRGFTEKRKRRREKSADPPGVENRPANAERPSTDYEVGAFLLGDGASPGKGMEIGINPLSYFVLPSAACPRPAR